MEVMPFATASTLLISVLTRRLRIVAVVSAYRE
jgi:hypothetical protein